MVLKGCHAVGALACPRPSRLATSLSHRHCRSSDTSPRPILSPEGKLACCVHQTQSYGATNVVHVFNRCSSLANLQAPFPRKAHGDPANVGHARSPLALVEALAGNF